MTLPREFSLIARHFGPLAGPGALGLADDAALLDPPTGKQLILAADAMVEGVHFLAADPPETVGRKLLRVNLSDLAAMGAAPLGYLMTTAFGRGMDEAWIAGFAAGLAEDQRAFGLSVLGGDTVVTPGPACFSLTILGSVEPGRAIRRAGARPGDEVWVSGSIGDGALGLLVLAGQVAVGMPPSRPSPASAGEGVSDPSERLRGPLHAGHAAFLAERYRLPQPRLALGQAVAAHVSAGMDVSDGLVQDLGHLCRAAGCGAEIAAADIPLSDAARAALAADPRLLPTILAGGDDYELLLAVPPGRDAALAEAARAAGVPLTRIGRFHAGPAEVTVTGPDGAPIPLDRAGWSHFA